MRDVNVGHKFMADYQSIILKELLAEIRRLAEPLKGKRVLHVNATSFGGGVAEILYTLVPLMNDVGLEAEWQVLTADNEFFNVTKSFHNGLQGAPVDLTDEVRTVYEEVNRRNAEQLSRTYDFVVIHDPQPAALRSFAEDDGAAGAHWIWRCHIDTSTPNQALYDYLLPFIRRYDRAIYTMGEYAPDGIGVPVEVVPPAIDPLAPKNMTLVPDDARYIVRQFGIDVDRPLLLQVSRFDPWKDPLGVVDAYRTVKTRRPEVQLALIGSMASDDPEGWEYLDKLTDYVGGDPDVFVLSNLDNIGSVEVNAFQSHAAVVIQKSTREGFGLTVSEGLWKARPVVAGNVGGIPLQVQDGSTGFLVESSEACAERCLEILDRPEWAHGLARQGKEYVRRNFLTPRLLRDYLRIFTELSDGAGAS
ncbi:MAG TPA: glycosyltransferase [Thermoleophilia bacterium]|nr:glycosyltransferase [Thermoleophilia bacterium]